MVLCLPGLHRPVQVSGVSLQSEQLLRRRGGGLALLLALLLRLGLQQLLSSLPLLLLLLEPCSQLTRLRLVLLLLALQVLA